jgi:hypothetical protein
MNNMRLRQEHQKFEVSLFGNNNNKIRPFFFLTRHQWLTPVILAAREAEIRSQLL